MRIADVQLAYPALLLAMMIDGAARSVLGQQRDVKTAIAIVIISIGIAFWVQYARTIRSSVLVERDQDYVAAARVTGRSALGIVVLHILPNVMAPVLVIATINLGVAIITEATLSFLGIGIPLTQPSLGTLTNAQRQQLPAVGRVVDRGVALRAAHRLRRLGQCAG